MSSNRSAYSDNEPGHIRVSSIHGAEPAGNAAALPSRMSDFDTSPIAVNALLMKAEPNTQSPPLIMTDRRSRSGAAASSLTRLVPRRRPYVHTLVPTPSPAVRGDVGRAACTGVAGVRWLEVQVPLLHRAPPMGPCAREGVGYTVCLGDVMGPDMPVGPGCSRGPQLASVRWVTSDTSGPCGRPCPRCAARSPAARRPAR